jgi:hypothetical protein
MHHGRDTDSRIVLAMRFVQGMRMEKPAKHAGDV